MTQKRVPEGLRQTLETARQLRDRPPALSQAVVSHYLAKAGCIAKDKYTILLASQSTQLLLEALVDDAVRLHSLKKPPEEDRKDSRGTAANSSKHLGVSALAGSYLLHDLAVPLSTEGVDY
eukprot:GHVU01026848.1.p2 GENE.GHVU01026848.1~~GHVU01026848.1.p2  ORF type:complete len:121 (-),score=26.39 GHVU01026848.1:1257-1619(-)